MSRFFTLLALASTVYALPAPAGISADSIGSSITSVFHTGFLTKRQNYNETLDGLGTLLALALRGQNTGQCKSECESWVNLIEACTADDEVSGDAIGRCACGESPVKAMATCGACFGDDSAKVTSDFDGLCTKVGLVSGDFTSSSSSSSSTSFHGSGTSSASDVAATAAGSVPASGAVKNIVGGLVGLVGVVGAMMV